MPPEKRALGVYSISHLKAETVEMLESCDIANLPFCGGPYGPYGWFAYAHDENLGMDPIPEDLWAVMLHAIQHGCSNILIDRDADTVEDLPVYEW